MKISRWLTLAAEAVDGGFTPMAVSLYPPPPGWDTYLVMTLPACDCYDHHAEDVIGTRVMRFLLAAAIARSQGE